MSSFKKLFLAGILFTAHQMFAEIRLPKILGNNMVLQREKPITIWGWATAGEKVTVQFNKQTKNTKTDKSGHWIVTLLPEAAGGPFALTVKGKNTITLTNILVGEVWVCSGQSNMEWPVHSVTNTAYEIQNANFPEIRHFTVEKSISTKLEEDVKGGEWSVCSPQNVGDFTAVGYFFAREVYQKTKIPIGLVNTSWGGTHSETWTSRQALEQSDEFKDMIASMPVIDLDQLAKEKKDALEKKLAERNIKIASGNEAIHWKETGFDHTQWPVISVPQQWETTLGDIDGTLWFRKEFTLPAEDASQPAKLELGMIDDNDETFVNGVLVGGIHGYNIKRVYAIPSSLLKEGKNVIAVKSGGHGWRWRYIW